MGELLAASNSLTLYSTDHLGHRAAALNREKVVAAK
jgi:hypothetical protein